MNKEPKILIDNRMHYIFKLGELLQLDSEVNHVDSICYSASLDKCDEYVIVIYKDGDERKLLITNFDNEQILREVVREVYDR